MGGKNPGREQTLWHIRQLRTIAFMSLVCSLAVGALWIFAFLGMSWQVLLAASLAGFQLSWSAAVLGVRNLTRQLEGETSLLLVNPKTAMELARYGLFLGVLLFVAFFLIDFRLPAAVYLGHTAHPGTSPIGWLS